MIRTKNNKIRIAIGIAVFLGSLFAEAGLAQNMNTVIVTENGFSPQRLEINQGQGVTFRNEDKESRWPASNIHPTHEIYPAFDPKKPIGAGKEWHFTFDMVGTWYYHDHIYPEQTGSIVVRAAGTDAQTDQSVSEASDQSHPGFFKRIINAIGNFFGKIYAALFGRGGSSSQNNGSPTNQNSPSKDKKDTNDTGLGNSQYKGQFADIAADSKEIYGDEPKLKAYIQKFGIEKTIQHLNQLSFAMGSCHDTAHKAGRIGYELYGSDSFKLCSMECQSGCYHGATEAYFRDHGTANLAENLKTLCSDKLNPFFTHQCLHGIGHGLMAWTNYEIVDALKSCDVLDKGKDSCYSGVFMENIVGGLNKASGHVSRYLSSDPLFPCNSTEVGDQYKWSCYFLQSSRMIQIFGLDFYKIAQACEKAPDYYQPSCFSSMGRDAGGMNKNNPAAAIAACSYAPAGNLRNQCLGGAVQDALWDPTGQDVALTFCRMLTATSEKDTCYTTISERAPQIFMSKEDNKKFCLKAESEYQSMCLGYIR